jgi:hypothetical protein
VRRALAQTAEKQIVGRLTTRSVLPANPHWRMRGSASSFLWMPARTFCTRSLSRSSPPLATMSAGSSEDLMMICTQHTMCEGWQASPQRTAMGSVGATCRRARKFHVFEQQDARRSPVIEPPRGHRLRQCIVHSLCPSSGSLVDFFGLFSGASDSSLASCLYKRSVHQWQSRLLALGGLWHVS